MKTRLTVSTFLIVSACFITISAQNKPKKKDTARTIPVTTQQIIEQNQPEIVNPTEQTQNQPVEEKNTQNQPESQSFQTKIDDFSAKIKDITNRLGSLESSRRGELDEKQRRLLLNLEILSRAEQRAENLRQKLFEATEKENQIKSRLDQIEYESSEEAINRSAALVGGLRPEVIREQKRKTLENEKANLNALLRQIQSNKSNLEENVSKADLMVEKLRSKLEVEIDTAFDEQK